MSIKRNDDVVRLLTYIENLLKRDDQYTQLLEQYVKHQHALSIAQLWFKIVFFLFVCLIFVFVIVFGALGIYCISQKENITWQDIGAALAGLGSILSVIIILPSKIAEHLFPSTGDKDGIEFVKSMQSYDLSKNNRDDLDIDKILSDSMDIEIVDDLPNEYFDAQMAKQATEIPTTDSNSQLNKVETKNAQG